MKGHLYKLSLYTIKIYCKLLKPQTYCADLWSRLSMEINIGKIPVVICGNLQDPQRHSASSCKVLQGPACTLECADCFKMFKTFAMIWHMKKLLYDPCRIRNAPVSLCRMYLPNEDELTIQCDLCSALGSFLVILAMTMTMTINSNSVLLIRVTLAGQHESFEHANTFHSWLCTLKTVVIFFVAQLTCCILVILTVYYIICACNISLENSVK